MLFLLPAKRKIREEEFAFSRHPAITAFTSMNVETPTIVAYLFDHPLYLVATELVPVHTAKITRAFGQEPGVPE